MADQWRGTRLFRLSLTFARHLSVCWAPLQTTRDDNRSRRQWRSRPQYAHPPKQVVGRSARLQRPPHAPRGRWRRPGATHGRQGKPGAKLARAPRLVSVGFQLSWCLRECGVILRSGVGSPRVTIGRCVVGNLTNKRAGFTLCGSGWWLRHEPGDYFASKAHRRCALPCR